MTTKAELRKLIEELKGEMRTANVYDERADIVDRIESLLAREDEPERVARERLPARMNGHAEAVAKGVAAYWDHPGDVDTSLRAAINAALDAAERSRT